MSAAFSEGVSAHAAQGVYEVAIGLSDLGSHSQVLHHGHPDAELMEYVRPVEDKDTGLVHVLTRWGLPHDPDHRYGMLWVKVWGLRTGDVTTFELSSEGFYTITNEEAWRKSGHTTASVFGSLAGAVFEEGRARGICP